jgi:hypothetical protein
VSSQRITYVIGHGPISGSRDSWEEEVTGSAEHAQDRFRELVGEAFAGGGRVVKLDWYVGGVKNRQRLGTIAKSIVWGRP